MQKTETPPHGSQVPLHSKDLYPTWLPVTAHALCQAAGLPSLTPPPCGWPYAALAAQPAGSRPSLPQLSPGTGAQQQPAGSELWPRDLLGDHPRANGLPSALLRGSEETCPINSASNCFCSLETEGGSAKGIITTPLSLPPYLIWYTTLSYSVTRYLATWPKALFFFSFFPWGSHKKKDFIIIYSVLTSLTEAVRQSATN